MLLMYTLLKFFKFLYKLPFLVQFLLLKILKDALNENKQPKKRNK
jgi:hypothetical protein